MSYAAYQGYRANSHKAGIHKEVTNPSQIGYSVNKPLDRVRKHSLDNVININSLNFPSANRLTNPSNSLGTLANFTDQASQFASDIYNEGKTFLTDQTVSNVPNYWLVIGGALLMLVFKTGKHRGRKR